MQGRGKREEERMERWGRGLGRDEGTECVEGNKKEGRANLQIRSV